MRLFLNLLLALLLIAPSFSQDIAFKNHLMLLSQIKLAEYFPYHEEEVMGKSISLLLKEHSHQPISRQNYLQKLELALSKSGESKEVFLQNALRTFVASLPDPYASLLSSQEVQQEKEMRTGKQFTGFGLELSYEGASGVVTAPSARDYLLAHAPLASGGHFARGVVKIVGVFPGSPAELQGIHQGDDLLLVNQEKINRLQEANVKITPSNCSPCFLTLQRGNQKLIKKIFPGAIHLIPFAVKTFQKFGYVEMDAILPENQPKFIQALQTYTKEGKKFLVLDLRHCFGGDVETAARIAGLFLKPREIVYIKRTKMTQTPYLNSMSLHFFIPVTVLTSQSTASAAELLAGALQDHHRAKIYGEPTLGKSTIQTTWSLPDGSALRLTTAQYLLPSGKLLKIGNGIMPDRVYGFTSEKLETQLQKILQF